MAEAKFSYDNTRTLLETLYPNTERVPHVTEEPSQSDFESYASSPKEDTEVPKTSRKRTNNDSLENILEVTKLLKSQNNALWKIMTDRKAKRNKRKEGSKAKNSKMFRQLIQSGYDKYIKEKMNVLKNVDCSSSNSDEDSSDNDSSVKLFTDEDDQGDTSNGGDLNSEADETEVEENRESKVENEYGKKEKITVNEESMDETSSDGDYIPEDEESDDE